MCKFYKFYICAVVGIIIEYTGFMFYSYLKDTVITIEIAPKTAVSIHI